jgi:hypothetical protein
LVDEILRIYQNAIFILSLKDDDKNNARKRSLEIIDDKDSKNLSKKRKISEKKNEKVRVFVGSGQGPIDDGHCWRKYGQKEIHGSKNPRGYYRCTHRFTKNCLAVKQVQKSDTDPSIFEVKYLGNHTCNNTSSTNKTTTTNFSVSMFEEENRALHETEKPEDVVKPEKTDETMVSLEDLESKKNIFRTFSFSNHEIENGGGVGDGWRSNIFPENLMEKLSPSTSGSGITSEIVTAPASVEISETADSYFSNLDNIIDFGQDWLWS